MNEPQEPQEPLTRREAKEAEKKAKPSLWSRSGAGDASASEGAPADAAADVAAQQADDQPPVVEQPAAEPELTATGLFSAILSPEETAGPAETPGPEATDPEFTGAETAASEAPAPAVEDLSTVAMDALPAEDALASGSVLPTGGADAAASPTVPVEDLSTVAMATQLPEDNPTVAFSAPAAVDLPTVAMNSSPVDLPTVALGATAAVGGFAVNGGAATSSAANDSATVAFAAAESSQTAAGGAGAGDNGSGSGSGGGIGAMIRKHPKAWLASALAVAFLILGTGAVFAGVAFGTDPAVVASTPTPTVDPPRPVPAALPGASRLRTCSIAGLSTDPRLMNFQGYVMNAGTGEVLFDRGGTTPARTASVLKVLTAAAAIKVLGPDYQLTTRVVAGSTPGSIVLIGGGDPTLSQGYGSFYNDPPQLSDLAAQVKANFPGWEDVTEIVLDASMWDASDKWDPSWNRKEQRDGYQSEVTALMVDGDRDNPSRSVSARGTDPIQRAGQAFAEAMGLYDATLTVATAPAGTAELAAVRSQPVRSLIGQMLQSSDNTLGEMLARVTSKVSGQNGSAASLQQAIPAALSAFGLNTAGVTIVDGSGLSDNNAVSPAFVSQLMVKVMAGGDNLNAVWDGLPVAGVSGSLASRFNGDNAVARGAVTAKTGWIDTGYTLAGGVAAADGSKLTFAFYALGEGIDEDAKIALDTLATGIFNCGDNLSNN